MDPETLKSCWSHLLSLSVQGKVDREVRERLAKKLEAGLPDTGPIIGKCRTTWATAEGIAADLRELAQSMEATNGA